MTVSPQTKFKCDRCYDEVAVGLQSGAPAHARADGPEGWLTLKIGSDPGTPPSHLCPPCAFGFNAYMQGEALVSKTMVPAPPPSA